MRRISSLYALEKPWKKSHTFLVSLSFTTDGGHGDGGEFQQNSSRVKISDRDINTVAVSPQNYNFVDTVADRLKGKSEHGFSLAYHGKGPSLVKGVSTDIPVNMYFDAFSTLFNDENIDDELYNQ
ncbi:hypothetical protein Bca4012_085923 [Brassica carinata]